MALQSQSEDSRRIAHLEQECEHLASSLKVHEEASKAFTIERKDHEVLQQRLESRYKSLNQKYQD